MTWSIREGDVLDRLREMPDESVQCCVTSPPYWGLRDYGVEGQLGLEKTPGEFIANMVAVFEEVRRVLREDGTCWVNIGDSYANPSQPGGGDPTIGSRNVGTSKYRPSMAPGLKPKDLCLIPFRLAIALQEAGWYVRSDIIWAKPNPMPESVRDRPTKAHEYVFLLSKAARYFYDAEAIAEEANPANHRPSSGIRSTPPGSRPHGGPANGARSYTSRNARTVWTINPQPTPEAHFATFPEALAERCILAGTSAHGACSKCGAPWERVVDAHPATFRPTPYDSGRPDGMTLRGTQFVGGSRSTVGWSPTCDCRGGGGTHGQPYAARPCLVLDPFAGSGTTLLVAERLGRDSIGIELNPEYIAIAERRIKAHDPTATIELAPGVKQASLFTGDMP